MLAKASNSRSIGWKLNEILADICSQYPHVQAYKMARPFVEIKGP